MTAQLNAEGDVAVLVPAAGAGLRLGPGGPKALRLLAGEPLLVHAIRRVAAAPSVRLIVVAAPAAELDAVRALLAPVAPVTVVAGGAERQESVSRALAAVPAAIDIVLVHDAARALTPPELIESVAAAVRSGAPAVIPVLPVVDTIKEVGPAAAAAAPPIPSDRSAEVSVPAAATPASSDPLPTAAAFSAGVSPGVGVAPVSPAAGSSAGVSSGVGGPPASPAASASSAGVWPGVGASPVSPAADSSAAVSSGVGASPASPAARGSSAGASSAADGSAAGSPAAATPLADAPLEVVLGTVDRAVLRSVQTPQGFRHEVLAAAHAAAIDPLTDDAGLVEKAGLPVSCVPGSDLAMKITRPLDLILAEALLHVR